MSLFPPDRRMGHCPSRALGIQGRRQQFLPISFQQSRPQVRPTAPSLLLGAGYVPPAPARIRPVMQGLRWSCPVPSHRPRCDGIIRTWDWSLFLPPPVTVPQTYSHYHPWECCNFLYFQFLNYIDYHIKHSWCYRNRLKIISLYLPNINETY